jgi:hypothetical protein
MASAIGDLMNDGLSAPLGSVIAAVGRGVADAQQALDQASLAQTIAIYQAQGEQGEALLREIGYRPTFYVLPETTCEVQLSMRIGGSGAPDGSAGTGGTDAMRTYVTPVDAGFANRYGFQIQAAAKLSFKIVPVPPPAALDDLRPVPDLLGRAGDAAVRALQTLDLKASAVDDAGTAVPEAELPSWKVTQQSVPAARLLRATAEVVLTVVKA